MGYINDFEQELRARLDNGFSDEDIKWLKETVLQSYRNGVERGMKAVKHDRSTAQKSRKEKKP